MNSKILIFVLFSLLAYGFSCKKQNVSLEDGTYTGTFTVKYNDSKLSGPVTLEFQNGRYNCTAETNRIPAGGVGSFVVENKTITFNSEGVYTADFDWNLILSGTYNYTFDGKYLNLSADKNGVGRYEYKVEKED